MATIIIIVFISFGFLAAFVLALCWFLRWKMTRNKHVQGAGILHVDEHKKVKEGIIEGPHGMKTVVIEMEDDVHIGEAVIIKKDEKFGGNTDTVIEVGKSCSGSGHDDHQQLEHKA
ncbi:hypothetical protein ACFE04_012597 [Oxalis oulophora]